MKMTGRNSVGVGVLAQEGFQWRHDALPAGDIAKDHHFA